MRGNILKNIRNYSKNGASTSGFMVPYLFQHIRLVIREERVALLGVDWQEKCIEKSFLGKSVAVRNDARALHGGIDRVTRWKGSANAIVRFCFRD